MSSKHHGSIEIDALKALLALVEQRSVTRAADHLNMTQSGMSHALRRLRNQFDDPLLVRSSTGMVPTPRALDIAERAARILAEVDALATRAPSFDPKSARRVFTIAADDNMSIQLSPRLLAQLSQLAPGIDLQIVTPPTQPGKALEQGQVDLVLGLLEPEQAGLYTQRLFDDAYVGVVRKGHPTLSRQPTLDEFATAGHVIISARLPARSLVDDELARRGLRRRLILRIPHFLAAVRVVAETDLVLTLSRRLARSVVDDLAIRTFKLPIELPSVPIHQTWHERMNADPAHLWLRGLIAKLIRRAGKKRPS